jgi:hypothetical protein
VRFYPSRGIEKSGLEFFCYKVNQTLLKKITVASLQSNRFEYIAIVLVMSLITLFVCHPLLSLAFWGDDTFLMTMAAKHNVFELLFKGPGRAISQNNFMPLLGISFYIDHLLFGINFLGYNLHSLFLLVAVGFLAYLFLQQLNLHRWPALAGGITLVVSPAMVAVAGLYSNRHYLFGLAFALLSLISILKWHQTTCSRWFWAAVCFYFLALCSKEIYAPLLVIAGFLVLPSKVDIKKTLTGYFSVFVLYLLLRWLMLGTVIGGYSRGIEVGPMFCYLIKSLPRLLQTVVWGGAAPREISGPAVALGVSILGATFLLAAKSSGLKGAFCFGGLLVLSLCVVAMTLSVPPVLYGEDPFYCHGDRLAVAFSSAIWLSFWYLAGRRLTEKEVSPLIVLLLALVIIGPLMFYGGLATANNWKKNRATIDQVTFLNNHASQKLLIVGHPAWFLQYYLAMLQAKNPGTLMQAIDRPGQPKMLRPEGFSAAVLIQPEKAILTTHSPEQTQEWLKEFTAEFCGLFPNRCPK